MERSAAPERELSGDKATRIVEAMRDSVARRGAAGSTFEQVAREAGVSRGLLHYYFGTKERLLVEVVRRDAEFRIGAVDTALAPTKTVDEVLDVLLASLQDMIENEPDTCILMFELFSAGRGNAEIADELSQLFNRLRERIAEILEIKQSEGVVKLRHPAEAVASYLLSIADGVSLQALVTPGRQPIAIDVHLSAARLLLRAD